MPSWLRRRDSSPSDNEADDSAPPHKAHLSHEVIAGAAAGFAAHGLQKMHAKISGETSKHGKIIDAAAALAAGYAVKLAEGKGQDLVDKYYGNVSGHKPTPHEETENVPVAVSKREEWMEVRLTTNVAPLPASEEWKEVRLVSLT